MKDSFFVLQDPATKQTLTVEVKIGGDGNMLCLIPSGYGDRVALDFYRGKLSVLVNPDPDVDEPEIIDLHPEAP